MVSIDTLVSLSTLSPRDNALRLQLRSVLIKEIWEASACRSFWLGGSATAQFTVTATVVDAVRLPLEPVTVTM